MSAYEQWLTSLDGGQEVEERAYACESDALTTGDCGSELDLGRTTKAGVRVGPHDAMRIPAFWQGVSLISGTIARLPFKLYERDEETHKIDQPLPRDRLSQLVSRPNVELDGFTFWRRTILHYLIWGNAYIWCVRDPLGRVTDMIHLLPDRTYALRWPGEAYDIVYGASLEKPPWWVWFHQDDVIHLHWNQNTARPVESYITWSHLRDVLGEALAAIDFSSTFFANGGRIGGILEIPAELKKRARDTVEQGFRDSYESRSSEFFKTIILRDGAKFQPAMFSFRDTQVIEAKEQHARQIARILNMPASMLNVEGASSYNSKQEDNRTFLEHTLLPIMETVIQQCNLRLLMPWRRRSHSFGYDDSELVRPQPPVLVDMAVKAYAGQIATTNEARAMLDLPPMAGGDQLLEPEQASGAPAAASQGDIEAGQGVNTETASARPEAAQSRLVGLLVFAGRKANKDLETMRRFLQFRYEQYLTPEVIEAGLDRVVYDFLSGARRILQQGDGDIQGRLNIFFDQFEDNNGNPPDRIAGPNRGAAERGLILNR